MEAAVVSTLAAVAKLALYSLLNIVAEPLPQLSVRAGFASQLFGGSFCAFCWAAGKCGPHITRLRHVLGRIAALAFEAEHPDARLK